MAILVFRIRSKSPLVSEIQHRCSSLWNYYGAVSRQTRGLLPLLLRMRKTKKNHAVVLYYLELSLTKKVQFPKVFSLFARYQW
jgi:hypothetical protein